MNELNSPQARFAEFEPTSLSVWKEKVLADLKGRALESLNWRTDSGIVMRPFYRSADAPQLAEVPGEFPFRRGDLLHADSADWQIVQEVSVNGEDPLLRMQEALAVGVYAFKLFAPGGSVATPAPYRPLFAAIDPESQALHLFANAADKVDLLAALDAELIAGKGDPRQLTGCFFHAGSLNPGLQGVWDREAEVLRQIGEAWPDFRCLGFDLGVFAESGATPVQQMAYGLAAVVDYVAAMTERGIAARTVFRNVAFAFSIDSPFFPEVAKLRAFRSLYAQLLRTYEVEEEEKYMPFIFAQGTTWNLTRYDQHTNLLRATTEGISAVLGGCDALALPAFDRAHGPENALSARMARNIQLLLRHESYLDQVIDPGGGSYYLETLTDQQAAAAWTLFQEIETKGGFLAYYEEMTQNILEVQQRKQQALARQKRILVGVNKYPNTSEVQPPKEMGFAAGDLFQPIGGESVRGADRFERLREQVDRVGQERGQRLRAFLLLFGDTRMRNARAIFSRNLIGSGGLEMGENTTPADLSQSITEAQAFQPEVLILCSADANYFAQAPALIAQLRKELPAAVILVAGKPEGVEALSADDYLFAGMDAITWFENLLPKLVN